MKQKGFTLVELMITLVVMGVLATSVLGMATSFITNAKLRSSADEFRTGLMTAKVEAIKRNASIIFNSDSTGGWGIDVPSTFTESGTLEHLQSKAAASSSLSVVAKDSNGAALTKFRFTGSGRPSSDASTEVPSPPSYPVTYYFSVANKVCGSESGITCLNVTITSGGQIKVCNPETASTSVYGCS